MLEILFFYAKEHPDLTYRQGMHELLAPILFVLHAESREDITHDQSLTLVSATVTVTPRAYQCACVPTV